MDERELAGSGPRRDPCVGGDGMECAAGTDFDEWAAWLDWEIAAGRDPVPPERAPEPEGISVCLGDAEGIDPGLLAAISGASGGRAGEGLGAQFGQDAAADVLPPGPALAALTEAAVDDVTCLSDDQLVGVLHAARRQENREAWKKALVIAEFARRREAEFREAGARGVPVHCRPGQFPGEELAMELLTGPVQTSHAIDDATDLTTRLPATLAGMAAGLIDEARAGVIAFHTRGMTEDDAALADDILAALAPGLRLDRLAAKAYALEMKLAPGAVRARREHARRTRQRVEIRREESGNALVAGREMDTADALASKAHIHALALRLRRAGIPGTLDQLRLLVFADLTVGRDPLDRVTRPAARDGAREDCAREYGAPQHGARQDMDPANARNQDSSRPTPGDPAPATPDSGSGGAPAGPQDNMAPPDEGHVQTAAPSRDDLAPAGDRTPDGVLRPEEPAETGTETTTDETPGRRHTAPGGKRPPEDNLVPLGDWGSGEPAPEACFREADKLSRTREAEGRNAQLGTATGAESTPTSSGGNPTLRGGSPRSLDYHDDDYGNHPDVLDPDPRPPAPMPATINLVVHAGTLFGWDTTPTEAGGWGLLDADETRAILEAASRHPATRWCTTIIGRDGTALAHGCSPGQHPWTPHRQQDATDGRDQPDSTGARGQQHSSVSTADSSCFSTHQPDSRGPAGSASFNRQPAPAPAQVARLAAFLRSLNLAVEPVAKGECNHVTAEPRYTPSRKLAHLVRVRTATCDAPGCPAQAVHTDLDHTTPYPEGPTDQCNLGPKCRRHHKTKQAPGWKVEQQEPGVIRWTLPSGRTHTTKPTVYHAGMPK